MCSLSLCNSTLEICLTLFITLAVEHTQDAPKPTRKLLDHRKAIFKTISCNQIYHIWSFYNKSFTLIDKNYLYFRLPQNNDSNKTIQLDKGYQPQVAHDYKCLTNANNRPLYLRMQIAHFRSRHSLEKYSFVQMFTHERINSQE